MADTPRYTTVVEVKAAMSKAGSEFDTPLAMLIVSAEDTIDRVCNHKDGFLAASTATARTFPGSNKAYQPIDECGAAPTLVAVKDSPSDTAYVSWAAADWVAFTGDPRRPDFNPVKKPYTALMVTPAGNYRVFTGGLYSQQRGFRPDLDVRFAVPTVQVTAKWGYATIVPNPVRMATVAQTLRWFKRAQGAWQDAIQSASMGTLMFTKVLDPDIELMLIQSRLVRPAVG